MPPPLVATHWSSYRSIHHAVSTTKNKNSLNIYLNLLSVCVHVAVRSPDGPIVISFFKSRLIRTVEAKGYPAVGVLWVELRHFSLKLEPICRSPFWCSSLNFLITSRLFFIGPIRTANFVAFEIFNSILVVKVIIIERFRSRKQRVFSTNVPSVFGYGCFFILSSPFRRCLISWYSCTLSDAQESEYLEWDKKHLTTRLNPITGRGRKKSANPGRCLQKSNQDRNWTRYYFEILLPSNFRR